MSILMFFANLNLKKEVIQSLPLPQILRNSDLHTDAACGHKGVTAAIAKRWVQRGYDLLHPRHYSATNNDIWISGSVALAVIG
jgi:hypothetical protein